MTTEMLKLVFPFLSFVSLLLGHSHTIMNDFVFFPSIEIIFLNDIVYISIKYLQFL